MKVYGIKNCDTVRKCISFLEFNNMASSYPLDLASLTDNIEFIYWPEALAVAGIALWENFSYGEIVAFTPFLIPSSPK